MYSKLRSPTVTQNNLGQTLIKDGKVDERALDLFVSFDNLLLKHDAERRKQNG